MRCGLVIISFCSIYVYHTIPHRHGYWLGPPNQGSRNQPHLNSSNNHHYPDSFVTLYTCFTCVFLKLHYSDIRLKDRHIIHSWNCIKSFALIIQMVAAITEVGGAVLFLVAGYTEQSGSIRSIGHVAGMIGIRCCFFLLPFSPDNCVNLNWRQLQCTCKSTYCSVSV